MSAMLSIVQSQSFSEVLGRWRGKCKQSGATAKAVPAWQERSCLLVGQHAMEKLHSARVLVVGVGGVGSYAVEALARAGVGALTMVDGDTVDITNVNRQLHAMTSTIGQLKVEVMAARCKDIAPGMTVITKQEFILPESAQSLLEKGSPDVHGVQGPYDFVLDAIDSVAPKKLLIEEAFKAGLPIVSSMGAGGRLDPGRVKVVPLSSTYNDSFAANLRKGLRKKKVDLTKVACVWSDEPAALGSLHRLEQGSAQQQRFKRSFFGTSSMLPATFGLHAAAFIVNSLIDGPMLKAYEESGQQTWMESIKTGQALKRDGHNSTLSSGGGPAVLAQRRMRQEGQELLAKQRRKMQEQGHGQQQGRTYLDRAVTIGSSMSHIQQDIPLGTKADEREVIKKLSPYIVTSNCSTHLDEADQSIEVDVAGISHMRDAIEEDHVDNARRRLEHSIQASLFSEAGEGI